MRYLRGIIVTAVILLVTSFQAVPWPYTICAARCPIGNTPEAIEIVCWPGLERSGHCTTAAEGADEAGCCSEDPICPAKANRADATDCGDKGNCPMGQPQCFFCLPGRILAEKSPELASRYQYGGDALLTLATASLNESFTSRQSEHSHSPPGPILASSGREICTEVCLLLI